MTVREEIAKNILFYRKKMGLTQKELAELVGVKNSAVSNWEKGLNSIDIDTLHEVCKIFDVSINDMFGVFANSNDFRVSGDEKNLVIDYRELSQQGQEYVKQTIYMARQVYSKSPSADNTLSDDIAAEIKQSVGNKTAIDIK